MLEGKSISITVTTSTVAVTLATITTIATIATISTIATVAIVIVIIVVIVITRRRSTNWNTERRRRRRSTNWDARRRSTTVVVMAIVLMTMRISFVMFATMTVIFMTIRRTTLKCACRKQKRASKDGERLFHL